jgi:hypothetical protein
MLLLHATVGVWSIGAWSALTAVLFGVWWRYLLH